MLAGGEHHVDEAREHDPDHDGDPEVPRIEAQDLARRLHNVVIDGLGEQLRVHDLPLGTDSLGDEHIQLTLKMIVCQTYV
ncbi:MAG TPA: hypothetical protein VK983_05815 [Candidatus Limnocylindrales bacterium]|nr:hypothetical protein [Candidatus Limnocylindrales bacterium]